MIEKVTEPKWMRRMEFGLLLLMTGIFCYALYDYLSPYSSGYQPLKMVFLSAAMVLQPAASLVRERFRWATYVLMATSMLLLLAMFAV